MRSKAEKNAAAKIGYVVTLAIISISVAIIVKKYTK
ncbi:MAG: hypothetical protein BWY46_01849 [Firmicutes bacterium ADurb.Bin300]|nr:MAG: hypothetical protein BWY46_01849 [Firmicutes bacterium ADurb.Bin300]